jgi:hypothetical protein
VLLAGCNTTVGFFLPQPIPLGLDGGALTSTATVNSQTFPVVLDTGSPVTVWNDQTGRTLLQTGTFTLNDINGVPRLELDNLGFYISPLRSLGPNGFTIGGVLGGDNLQRWVLRLDYRVPAMTIFDQLTPCDCELAQDNQVAMRFALAGGGADRDVAIGNDVVAYPPSRVLLEACLEPLWDPLSRDLQCSTSTPLSMLDMSLVPTAKYYLPSGVDTRLIVATGFPGMALSASVFDRLRGSGAAKAALATPTKLHLPDAADDGDGATGLTVGLGVLGRDQVAALVLVARQGYLGACAEVARSRRQRRNPLDHPRTPENGDPDNESGCFLTDACYGASDPANCDDFDHRFYVSPMLEIDDTVPVYILPDGAPLLVGINADVRPSSATVDGILGTEFLRRVFTYIDYPQHRISMRCFDASTCLGYATFVDPYHIDVSCSHKEICGMPAYIPHSTGGLAAPL